MCFPTGCRITPLDPRRTHLACPTYHKAAPVNAEREKPRNSATHNETEETLPVSSTNDNTSSSDPELGTVEKTYMES